MEKRRKIKIKKLKVKKFDTKKPKKVLSSRRSKKKEAKKVLTLLPKKSGFPYTNTRVRVMKTKLLNKPDMEKLMKMSLEGITSFLQQTEYKDEINKMALQYSGVELAEYALNRNMAHNFRKILSFSISDAYEQIQLYLKKWDIWNIKTILRGKHTAASKPEIFNSLIPAGEFSEEFLKEIIEKAENVEEAIEFFSHTEYYEILEKFRKDKNLIEVEDELDRKYFSELLSIPSPQVNDFVRMEIDSLNTLNSMRSENIGVKIKDIEGGYEKDYRKSKKDIKEMRTYLRKVVIEKGRKMLHDYKASIAPVVGYFVWKENEIKNLRIIMRGKHSELPAEMIEKELVI